MAMGTVCLQYNLIQGVLFGNAFLLSRQSGLVKQTNFVNSIFSVNNNLHVIDINHKFILSCSLKRASLTWFFNRLTNI